MGIVDEDVARVREDSDIVAVVTQYTQLRRVGRRFSGLCPFHAEKSPSFSVNHEEGVYYCFGCGVGGDVITFVREKEQLDFVGAVEWLANKFSISLRYTDTNEGENRRRKSRLQDAVAKAVEFYHDRLLSASDAGAARSYLRQRGYDGETVRRFKIGWAGDDWDLLARSLKLSNTDLTDSGLGFVNRRGRQQDAFRSRIMFPVFDAQGNAVGFGGRIMPGAEGPKYKNSSESTVYAKSRLLYGLNWAKTQIVEADEVVVCEGYTDVIAFFNAGMARAVATCGTALTDDHVKLLRRFARRVVLAFDADAAGQNAAARFYEWERAHDLDVAVADLPPGVDPGELGQDDPERLRKAVSEARPFLEFRVERVFGAADLGSAEGRARAADQALGMIAEHPDPLVRDQYVMDVATRCRIDVDLVRTQLGNRSASARNSSAALSASSASSGAIVRPILREGPELEALKLAAQDRSLLADLLVPELFTDELAATVFDLLGRHEKLHEVIDAGGPEVGELV
ncbi:MAG: DNA primase, partial [Acidimicrobiia bacterium]|nr:DNA primase [Acidimicrobiia bacterium]